MALRLRAGTPADTAPCGRICYEAFYQINTAHRFPPDFPDPEAAIRLLAWMLGDPGFYVVVAERHGQIIGSNAVDERAPIAGIGPITVAPPNLAKTSWLFRVFGDAFFAGTRRQHPGVIQGNIRAP